MFIGFVFPGNGQRLVSREIISLPTGTRRPVAPPVPGLVSENLAGHTTHEYPLEQKNVSLCCAHSLLFLRPYVTSSRARHKPVRVV